MSTAEHALHRAAKLKNFSVHLFANLDITKTKLVRHRARNVQSEVIKTFLEKVCAFHVRKVDQLLPKEVLIVIHVHQEIFFPPLVVNHVHRANTTN